MFCLVFSSRVRVAGGLIAFAGKRGVLLSQETRHPELAPQTALQSFWRVLGGKRLRGPGRPLRPLGGLWEKYETHRLTARFGVPYSKGNLTGYSA